MLIIQHRANSLSDSVTSNCAEIDIHLDVYGDLGVKHDVCESGWILQSFLERTGYKNFFVDIKQNLSTKDYLRVIEIFGDRLIGLFDVPMPAAYFLSRDNIPFYARLSEFELPDTLSTRYWLDPLTKWDGTIHNALLTMLAPRNRVVVACPSLHGQSVEKCENVWSLFSLWDKTEGAPIIEGIVTKHVLRCQEFFNG